VSNTTVIKVAINTTQPSFGGPTLHFYSNDAPHPSGYGDGQVLIGIIPRLPLSTTQTATFAALGDLRGKWVTATQTRNVYYGFLVAGATPQGEFPDTDSYTSEFSKAVKVE
jgi:hypothetical protein